MRSSSITNKSLSQIAYESIRHKIVSLELPPGEVIDENGLRQEMGLGRTPIREALQRLALEKLVTIVPRRGMFVTEIGLTDLQRLFEMRVSLEGMAARLATVRGNHRYWNEMENALNELEQQSGHDNLKLIEVDELCHHIIYEAADNKFLTDTLKTLYTLSLRMWYFSLSEVDDMQSAVDEHRVILETLRAGDPDKSAEILEQHIRNFQDKIQSVMIGTT